jgi:uncharacterized membrane protein
MEPDRHPPAPRARLTARRTAPAAALAALAAVAAVAAEIPYPLVSGSVRTGLTVAAVLAFAVACLAHAYATAGAGFAGRILLATAGAGWAFEVLGIHTGVPFGHYRYGSGLGPRVVGVPLLVPLAWTMLGYPSYVLARHVARSWPRRLAVGALGMAGWDLFLDPQLVAAGAWHWSGPGPSWPGTGGVPLVNTAGWLLAGLVVTGLSCQAARAPGRRAPAGAFAQPTDLVPLALLCWGYGSGLLANLAFFDRPWVALWGGLGMGPVVLALARRR